MIRIDKIKIKRFNYNMRKIIFVLFLLTLFSSTSFSQTKKFILEITNVTVNGGRVHVSIFFTAEEFKREIPSTGVTLESTGTVISHEFDLPIGEYLFSAYQDANNNGECDFFLGIPRELVAISNHTGRGIPPRDFNRLKVPVNAATDKVTIRLQKFL